MSEPWFKTAEQIEAEREAAELASRITYKKDIWDRCTEDEAELLDAALEQAPAKERRMFADAQFISHSDEYFGLLHSRIIEILVSEQRANEILAPSEV